MNVIYIIVCSENNATSFINKDIANEALSKMEIVDVRLEESLNRTNNTEKKPIYEYKRGCAQIYEFCE